MPDNNKTVVVIGAGPSGLSAAYYAQKAGYKVILLEKMNTAGEKEEAANIKNLLWILAHMPIML